MKRKMLLKILAIFTFLSLLCSCAPADDNVIFGKTNKTVVAYLSDASDGLISAATSIDKKLPDWLDFKYYDDVDKEATVVYNGVTYTGTYNRTYMLYFDNQLVDRYTSHHLAFCLTRDTKELCSISGAVLYENEPENKEQKFSEDQCIEIANTIAKQYIDISKFKVEASIYSSGWYLITYTKPYNNILTPEKFAVKVSYVTGEELGFEMRSIGQYDDEKITKNKASLDLLLKDGKVVADKKAREICKEVCDKKGYTLKSVTEKEESRILYRFDNGDFALITKYSVDFDAYDTHSESLNIITMVESPQTDTKTAENE